MKIGGSEITIKGGPNAQFYVFGLLALVLCPTDWLVDWVSRETLALGLAAVVLLHLAVTVVWLWRRREKPPTAVGADVTSGVTVRYVVAFGSVIPARVHERPFDRPEEAAAFDAGLDFMAEHKQAAAFRDRASADRFCELLNNGAGPRHEEG